MRRNLTWRYYLMVAGLSLLFATLACNAPSGTSNLTPTLDPALLIPSSLPGTLLPATDGQATQEGTEATSEATQSVLTPTSCNYSSVYVSDITIPDDTEMVAGTSFTKTWRVKNNGCQPWTTGTVLLFVEGNQMGGPVSVPVPETAVGGTQDISVPLITPDTPGEHKGYWRLRSSDGIQFGNKIYVKIISVTPTPTLTLTPTLTDPPPVTGLPDLYVSEFSLSPTTPVADSPVHVRIGIYNKGTAAAGTPFIVQWYGGENFANASCVWTIPSMVKNGGRIIECDFTFSSWYPSINTKVVVDATNVITESDETNNIFLKAISVAKD